MGLINVCTEQILLACHHMLRKTKCDNLVYSDHKVSFFQLRYHIVFLGALWTSIVSIVYYLLTAWYIILLIISLGRWFYMKRCMAD